MTEVTIKRHIAAPPDKVFAAATDFHHAAEHIQAIERMEVLTDGPVGLGTRFRETRKMFGREASEEMEVTEFTPPHSYSVDAESHGCRYHSVFRFTPSGSGTDIELTFQATPVTMLAKTMAAMMKPMMKKVMEECGKDLDDLKALLESGGKD